MDAFLQEIPKVFEAEFWFRDQLIRLDSSLLSQLRQEDGSKLACCSIPCLDLETEEPCVSDFWRLLSVA